MNSFAAAVLRLLVLRIIPVCTPWLSHCCSLTGSCVLW